MSEILWEIPEHVFVRMKDLVALSSQPQNSKISSQSELIFQICWTFKGLRFDLLRYWGTDGFITSFHEPSDFEGVRDKIIEAARMETVESILVV